MTNPEALHIAKSYSSTTRRLSQPSILDTEQSGRVTAETREVARDTAQTRIPIDEIRPCIPEESSRCLVHHLEPLFVAPARRGFSRGVSSRRLDTLLHGCGQAVNRNTRRDRCEMLHEACRLLGRHHSCAEVMKRGLIPRLATIREATGPRAASAKGKSPADTERWICGSNRPMT